MLGYIHACFPHRAAQEVRNDPRFATWGNRLFHAAPERAFIPKITLSGLSITSISDKKSPQTLAAALSPLQRISQ